MCFVLLRGIVIKDFWSLLIIYFSNINKDYKTTLKYSFNSCGYNMAN